MSCSRSGLGPTPAEKASYYRHVLEGKVQFGGGYSAGFVNGIMVQTPLTSEEVQVSNTLEARRYFHLEPDDPLPWLTGHTQSSGST